MRDVRLPISVRLSIVFGAMVLAILGAFGAFLYTQMHRNLTAAVDEGLRARAAMIAGTIADRTAIIKANNRYLRPDQAFAQVVGPDGHVVDSSANVKAAPMVPVAFLRSVRTTASMTRQIQGRNDPIRVLVAHYQQPGPNGFIVVGETLDKSSDALTHALRNYVVGGTFTLLLVLLAGWWLVRSALRPVERMQRQARTLSLNDPDQRLPVSRVDDELGRLGRTLNDMLDRMRRAYEHERHFIDYASHESRTPLTALRAEIDLALSRPRSHEDLRQALISAGEEADHLIRISDDLLALGKANAPTRPLRPTAVKLSDLTSAAWAPLAAEAERAAVSLRNEVPPETARLDAGLTQRALNNLFGNALRHAPRGSTITVRARSQGGRVEFDVTDEGAGFPDAFLPVAFEPFRRSDTHTDGSGLGLAIVDAVARVHGGEATATNAPGSGASVRLSLRTVPPSKGEEEDSTSPLPSVREPLDDGSTAAANH